MVAIDRDWAAYYANTVGRPPRPTLLHALDLFDKEQKVGFAVDLGCGNGRDTIELLRRGWTVLAIDAEPAATELLLSRADLPTDPRLQTIVARFDEAVWPPADLLNASFSLPLCAPEHFAGLWERIVSSLREGGRFAGQLFGERDSFAGDAGVTVLTETAVRKMLRSLTVEHYREEEEDGVTPRGRPKHWHILHIVARKP